MGEAGMAHRHLKELPNLVVSTTAVCALLPSWGRRRGAPVLLGFASEVLDFVVIFFMEFWSFSSPCIGLFVARVWFY
jgi:hypothetical protein